MNQTFHPPDDAVSVVLECLGLKVADIYRTEHGGAVVWVSIDPSDERSKRGAKGVTG